MTQFTVVDGQPKEQIPLVPSTPADQKSDAKPQAKPDAKPKGKPDAKPKGKPDAKPQGKPDAKPQAKPDAKPKGKSSQPSTDDPPATVDPTLTRILTWCRPHGSSAELKFGEWLREEIKRRGGVAELQPGGNISCTIERPDKKVSRTLFSSHIDTVHYTGGEQRIVYDKEFGHIFLDKICGTNCLGADDGAGVWLMLEMIKAKVPGTYMFHRGEEKGGIGAQEMTRARSDWLEEFEIAVAFDRPRDNEVITVQGGTRTASDKFAWALAKELNKTEGLDYAPSERGVFTDTKLYAGLISECTNIGVGYENQHGKDEFLDYTHLLKLRSACLRIDWDSLPSDRIPEKTGSYGSKKYSGYYGQGFDEWEGYPTTVNKPSTPVPPPKPQTATKSEPVQIDVLDEIDGMTMAELTDWVETYPQDAALTLIELASELASARAKMRVYKGVIG